MPVTRIITPPSVLPVSLAEACAHVRMEVGMDDATITSMVKAAEAHIADVYGILTTTQTVETHYECLPMDRHVRLRCAPALSLVSVNYFTPDSDTPQPLTDFATVPGLSHGIITSRSPWPSAAVSGLVVRYSGGWGATAASIPAPIKHAILLLAAAFYASREETVISSAIPRQLPIGMDALLSQYRVW